VRLLREPLLHFLFIGVSIYLLYGAFAEPTPKETDKTIIVNAAEIEWMKSRWEKSWNRTPTAEDLDNMVQQYVREIVLYREALNMGLNEHDVVIRRRLGRKLEFLAKDLATLTPPTAEELQAYFNAHLDRYEQPVRYSYTQIFFSPDIRGETTLTDAEKVKAILSEQGREAIDSAHNLGDRAMFKNYFSDQDAAKIERSFGNDFAKSLVALSPRQWHGPVLSGFGAHLVYVHQITTPPAPVLGEHLGKVKRDWMTAKGEELNETFYANLRAGYTIVIEPTQDAGMVPGLPQETP
jgi:hypothetical protein